MMQNEAEKQDQHRRDLEKKAATIDRRESNRSLEFDRALIFIRTIKVRDVVAVDVLSKNDLFVNLSFEQAPNGFASNLWKYKTPVRNEAGSQASWEVDGMEHIVTHSDNIRTKKIKFELWDKNRIWKDKKIGSAEIPLLMLLNHGFESSARVPIEIMNTANRLVGTGELEVFMSAPFNWLTCGLHEPKCVQDFLSSTSGPSLLNGFGCCLNRTKGQCHLPSGEKLCGLHLPECCSTDRPSVANCGGFLYGPTLGNCSSLDDGVGTCGLCSISMRCCGNELHVCPWLTHGCEELEMELGLPITFERAKISINEVKMLHLRPRPKESSDHDVEEITEDGLPKHLFESHYYFEVQLLDDKGNQAHHFISGNADRGRWYELEQFYTSSETLFEHDLEVRLWLKNPVGKDHLVGVGANGHDLVGLLKQGYGKSYKVPVALRAILQHKQTNTEVHTVVAKLEFNMRIDEFVPIRKHDNDGPQHKGTSSLFYDIQPERCVLNEEMFKEIPEENLQPAEAKKLKFESISDIEMIVGYQIELRSRSTSKSKGIWVIAGVKKFRFATASYLLKNKEGTQRWDALQKPLIGKQDGAVTSGRPFDLKRKVATF